MNLFRTLGDVSASHCKSHRPNSDSFWINGKTQLAGYSRVNPVSLIAVVTLIPD